MDVKNIPTPAANLETASDRSGIIKITDDDAGKAMTLLQKYKEQKKVLDERILENEEAFLAVPEGTGSDTSEVNHAE